MERLPALKHGDVEWLITLDLFVLTCTRQPVSMYSACVASGAPESSALRHIHRLRKAGVLMLVKDDADGRRSWVRFTEQGYRQVAAAIEAEYGDLIAALP